MRSLKIFLTAGAGIFNQITRSLASFITRKVFMVYIGASLLGLNTLYASVISVLTLTELGVGSAVAMFLYKPLAEEDGCTINAYLNLLRKFNIVMMLIVIVGGIILTPVVFGIIRGDYNTDEVLISYFLYLIATASSYYMSYHSTLLNADQKGYIVNLTSAVCNILMNIIQIIIIVYYHSYIYYLCAVIAYNIVNNSILANISKKRYLWIYDKSERLSIDKKKKFVSLIKDMLVYRIANYLIQSMDNIIISFMLGTIIVAYYGNYFLIISMMVAIVGNIGTATCASLGNQLYSDKEKLYASVKSILFVQHALFSATGVAVVVLADLFVQTFFGIESVCPKSLSISLAFFYYLQGIITPLENLRVVKGEYGDKYKQLGISVVNVIISVLLTYAWGVCGVVVGTILCYVFKAFFLTPGVIFGDLLEKNKRYEYLKYMIMFTVLFGLEMLTFGNLHVFFGQSFLLAFLANGLIAVGGVLFFNFLVLRKSKLYMENMAYFQSIIHSWSRSFWKNN